MKRLMMIAAAAVFSVQAATAQTNIDPDTLVAEVNGTKLTFSDLMMTYETLPQQYKQVGLGAVYGQLVERMIEQELMASAAQQDRIERDKDFQRQLAFIKKGLMEQFYLDSIYEERITEEKLKAAYDAFTPPVETEASHILVATKEEADAVIAQLQGGADFAELAKEKSTGPSGPNGGALGYFTAERMVPPFSQAAFSLEPGSITQTPVQTQFGWHVIKVTNRRQAPKPPLEQVRGALSLQAQEQVLDSVLTELKAAAKIEKRSLEEVSGQ